MFHASNINGTVGTITRLYVQMRQRFYVPQELALAWGVLISRYEEYLPEIKMEKDAFIAHPEEAAALLRELKEMASYRNDKDHHVR